MSLVRVLEDRVVDRIAAGEVVERPASVVKELLENALDAGGRRIEIRLKQGGVGLVEVSDDGGGMARDDAMLCIERHATSKIRSAEDLVGVITHGFRGEALPSIASVSRLELITRRPEDEVGTRVVVDGGTLERAEPVACPPGTTVSMRSLFVHTPARRKFLKGTGVELDHAIEAVRRAILRRPDVAVILTHDGRELLRAPATSDPAQRVRDVLGADAAVLIPVQGARGAVSVHGHCAPVGVHKAAATGSVYLFVNGRFVRDAVVRRAVTEAYRGAIPQGRHPVVVIEVTLPGDDVDVNVHPQKTEVRYRDPREVASVVEAVIRDHLRERVAERWRSTAEPAPEPRAERPRAHPPAHPDDDPRVPAWSERGPLFAAAPSGAALNASAPDASAPIAAEPEPSAWGAPAGRSEAVAASRSPAAGSTGAPWVAGESPAWPADEGWIQAPKGGPVQSPRPSLPPLPTADAAWAAEEDAWATGAAAPRAEAEGASAARRPLGPASGAGEYGQNRGENNAHVGSYAEVRTVSHGAPEAAAPVDRDGWSAEVGSRSSHAPERTASGLAFGVDDAPFGGDERDARTRGEAPIGGEVATGGGRRDLGFADGDAGGEEAWWASGPAAAPVAGPSRPEAARRASGPDASWDSADRGAARGDRRAPDPDAFDVGQFPADEEERRVEPSLRGDGWGGEEPPPQDRPGAAVQGWRARALLGVHDGRYAFVSEVSNLWIVDVAALSRRIAAAALVRAGAAAEPLLVPRPLNLARAETAALLEQVDRLVEVGVEVAALGPGRLALVGAPASLSVEAAGDVARRVAAGLSVEAALAEVLPAFAPDPHTLRGWLAELDVSPGLGEGITAPLDEALLRRSLRRGAP